MARYYNGEHPCPGCHEKIARNGKYEICFDCKETLEVGRKAQQQHQDSDPDEFCGIMLEQYNLSGTYRLEERGEGSRLSERLAEANLPYYGDGEAYSGRELLSVFNEFLAKLDVGKVKTTFKIEPRSSYRDSGNRYNVPVKFALPIINLMSWIGNAMEGMRIESYAKGKEAGSDLLGKLNSGEMSMKDFEKGLGSR